MNTNALLIADEDLIAIDLRRKLQTVRPYQIFDRVAQPTNGREATIKIPQRKDLPLLETALLIAALKSVKARRIFEFGTYLGNTTLNLALNSPDDAQIFTFDLPPGLDIQQHPEDVPFTQEHFAVPALAFAGSRVESKITVLTGNSLTADLSRFEKSMDFIFIDGGHDLATVTADTSNAIKMVRPGGCIAWHDHQNARYPELTEYLESLPQKPVAVGDTMLAFWFDEWLALPTRNRPVAVAETCPAATAPASSRDLDGTAKS